MPSEGVALTGIAVDRRIGLAGKSRLDLSLRRLGNELVLLSQMHKQGRTKIVDLFQVLFGVSAVIGDGFQRASKVDLYARPCRNLT